MLNIKVLLIVYLLYLVFQLKTHSYLCKFALAPFRLTFPTQSCSFQLLEALRLVAFLY